MKFRVTTGVLFSVVAALLLAAAPTAHHEILAKFDDKKPMSLTGIVTSVDWANPHVHLFMTVRTGNENVNWAIELASRPTAGRSSTCVPPRHRRRSATGPHRAGPTGSRGWGRCLAWTGTGAIRAARC